MTYGTGWAVYMGKAPRSLTSVRARNRVTTAAVTSTWAEVAVANGPVVIGGSPSSTATGR